MADIIKKHKEYEELRSASAAMGEDHDCTVIALAAACNVPYEKAHRVLASFGRRNSFKLTEFIHKAVKELGYRAVSVKAETFVKQYPAPHDKLEEHKCL